MQHFIEEIIPIIPGAGDKCSSIRALQRYLKHYDNGDYDVLLAMWGVQRAAWPSDHRRVAKAVNKIVLEKLCEIDIEELRVSGCRLVYRKLREAQEEIRHATSIPLDNRYTRYGIFHGSTNPRGYKMYAPEDGEV